MNDYSRDRWQKFTERHHGTCLDNTDKSHQCCLIILSRRTQINKTTLHCVLAVMAQELRDIGYGTRSCFLRRKPCCDIHDIWHSDRYCALQKNPWHRSEQFGPWVNVRYAKGGLTVEMDNKPMAADGGGWEWGRRVVKMKGNFFQGSTNKPKT